ncbi:hypothetical protein [Methylobrevis albus]|uniref:Uncharacterized protein n=1 Tax=Methylobrevis albus TaxID=2793297 RepID=A0A931N0R7_9HYPH|nr:hypothetical protein [Methylobrevis albus]MBH0239051.1 hypothetical protein [Methylobrevis albus]
MTDTENSLFALFLLAKSKAPSYFELLSAKNEIEFDKAFDAILEDAVIKIEQNGKNYANLNENGLTGVLAAALSIPGLTVTQETNSNGHVDLVIEADHCSPKRRKLGEAKIYNGPAYHVSGLDQLLNRYTTGREGRGLVITYVKKKNISVLMDEIRNYMDTNLPCNQKGASTNHTLKWSFLSIHTHSCGEDLQISHIGCNLFFGQDLSSRDGEQ